MRFGPAYQIPDVEEGGEEVPCPFVVPDVIESAVGREGSVPHGVRPVVLKVQVPRISRGGTVVSMSMEPIEGVSIPYHVDVLKEDVVPEGDYQLDADHLGVHHCDEAFVAVSSGFLGGHRFEIPGIVIRRHTQPLRQFHRLPVRREHEYMIETEPSRPGRAREIHQQFRLTEVARHDDDRTLILADRVDLSVHSGSVPPRRFRGDPFDDGPQFAQHVVQRIQIRAQHIPMSPYILFPRTLVTPDAVGVVSPRYQTEGEFPPDAPRLSHPHPALHVIRLIIVDQHEALGLSVRIVQ
mmetsp:Transcript_40902/g.123313  ORF Transcript_40902/g.123313 Transcript_40902/m.123313 type:complete len:295 (-) Transcript_40902:343-1227(-)